MPASPDTTSLRLFNTLTREVAKFEPRNPPLVTMYSCGPTVYADQHIGNMRTYVFSDTLKRALISKGLQVRHAINITDVGHLTSDADDGDDKLELAARREHRNAWEIAEHYTRLFKEDLRRLRVLEPDVWCKATEHVSKMIGFAEVLDRSGRCYQLPSGLYFDTSKDPTYGQLARLDLAGQREGARVEVVEGKRNPSDFAIWRTSTPKEKRQMEWRSPWGKGAPGWHLECSTMSIEYLGPHFDIHTGGVDHIPVHHTNEIAQSEAYLADGQPWIRWWLHGEFINLKGAKLSKSTGGAVLISDLLDRGYHPLVYRYLLLQAHYRSQIEFSWEAMDAARTGLRRLLLRFAAGRTEPGSLGDAAQAHRIAFDEAISEDLNTGRALAVVSAAAHDERISGAELSALAGAFDALLALGLSELNASDLDLAPRGAVTTVEHVDLLMADRARARANQDFARSDALRAQLGGLGVLVEDQPDGTSTWRWA